MKNRVKNEKVDLILRTHQTTQNSIIFKDRDGFSYKLKLDVTPQIKEGEFVKLRFV